MKISPFDDPGSEKKRITCTHMPKRAVPPDSSAAASSHDARHNHGLPVPQDAEASRRDGKSQSRLQIKTLCRNTKSISDYDLKIEHLCDNWIQIYFLVMKLLTIQALTKGLVRSCVGPYQLDKGHTASWTRDQGITDFMTYGTCPWLCTQEGRTPWSLEERDFISYASLHYQSTFSVRFEE